MLKVTRPLDREKIPRYQVRPRHLLWLFILLSICGGCIGWLRRATCLETCPVDWEGWQRPLCPPGGQDRCQAVCCPTRVSRQRGFFPTRKSFKKPLLEAGDS